MNVDADQVEHAGRTAVCLAVKDRTMAGNEGTGGVAYLDDVRLTEGTLEFEAFGEPNGGFGVCFGGQDLMTHEAVYFRPCAFSSKLTLPESGKFIEGRDRAAVGPERHTSQARIHPRDHKQRSNTVRIHNRKEVINMAEKKHSYKCAGCGHVSDKSGNCCGKPMQKQ